MRDEDLDDLDALRSSLDGNRKSRPCRKKETGTEISVPARVLDAQTRLESLRTDRVARRARTMVSYRHQSTGWLPLDFNQAAWRTRASNPSTRIRDDGKSEEMHHVRVVVQPWRKHLLEGHSRMSNVSTRYCTTPELHPTGFARCPDRPECTESVTTRGSSGHHYSTRYIVL